jgi:hypothetical protein
MTAVLELRYAGHSGVEVGLTTCRVGIAVASAGPRLRCELARPTVLRDALAALHDVSVLDDRVRRRTPAAVGAEAAAARRYADWVFCVERQRVAARDPLLSVYPDALVLEAASGDGRAYASVVARNGLFHRVEEAGFGSARCDLGEATVQQLGRLRGYRQTTLAIGAEGLAVGVERAPRTRTAPVTRAAFLRFVRIQRALTQTGSQPLELTTADVAALARVRAALPHSNGRRALRFELARQSRAQVRFEAGGPALVLSSTWRGDDRLVRVWGLDGLAVVERLAPSARRIRVWLGDSGAPWVWALDVGELTFTLGICGGSARDADLPDAASAAVLSALEELRVGTTSEVARAARVSEAVARAELVLACTGAVVGVEPGADVWRARSWLGLEQGVLTESFRQSAKQRKTRSKRKGGEGRSKEEATRARV